MLCPAPGSMDCHAVRITREESTTDPCAQCEVAMAKARFKELEVESFETDHMKREVENKKGAP